MTEELKKAIKELQKFKAFKEFKKKNPRAYLASCVTIIDGKNIGDWQLDYYQPKKHKMTTFIIKDKIELKGEDDIFQKEKKEIKELHLKGMKISLEKALEILEGLRKKKYEGDSPNKIIAVLQMLEDKAVWNLTLLTTTLKILNVKLSAGNGTVLEEKIENVFSLKAS